MKVITTLMLLALAFQVLPVALGIDYRKLKVRLFTFAFFLILGQLLLFQLGYWLGERFLYLVEGFKGTVIFIGFSLIGIRMVMEAFHVRKGERTYVMEKTSTGILSSFAQAVNTFLSGMLFTLLPVDNELLLIALLIFTIIVAVSGIVMNPGKTGRALASLLFLLGGGLMLFAALYLGFFI